MNTTRDAAEAATDADIAATHKAAAHRDTPAIRVLGAISEVADQPPLIALSLATLGVGVALRRTDVARTGARMLASHLLATGIKTLIKRPVDRTRPETAIETGERRFGPGHSHDHDQNAFPSGHTAGAVAVTEAIVRDHPAAAVPARLLAAGIGAVQIPRGTHYVGDVLAGAAIGWVAARMANAAVDRVERAIVGTRAGKHLGPEGITSPVA